MTDEEVQERLNSPGNLVKVIEKHIGGRGHGSTNVPGSVRDLIAITAKNSNETQGEIAETFGIDQSSVSEYKKGMVGGRLDKNLQNVARNVEETKTDDAHNAALDCLMSSLSLLQPKLVDPEIKPKDLSKIASDMSKIASNLKPKDKNDRDDGRLNVQVILVKPEQRKIENYEFIDV